jgi:hypothetical protein
MLEGPDLLAGSNRLLDVVLSEISICLCLSICDFSFRTSNLDFLYIATISFLVMGGGGPTCPVAALSFSAITIN